jgi:hypothetical protein
VRLDNLIAEYEALIIGQGGGGAPEATPAGTPIQGIHPDTFFGLGIAEASKKYLKLVGRAQHTRIIGDALARGGIKRPSDNSLFSILVRAAKGRDVVKVGKGMWGLAEWYPKRPAEPVEAKRKRRSGGRNRKAQKALPEPKAATEKLVVVKKRATERPAST